MRHTAPKTEIRFMKLRSLLSLALMLLCGLSLKAQSSDEVYVKVDENPVVKKTVMPKAPTGQSGLVAVLCVIDENGKVVQAVVTKSTNPALDASAVDAVQHWDFKPAKKDGKLVKTKVTIPLRFEEQV